ncbi:MAG: potassium channel family protein [Armatimonadota bacterium]
MRLFMHKNSFAIIFCVVLLEIMLISSFRSNSAQQVISCVLIASVAVVTCIVSTRQRDMLVLLPVGMAAVVINSLSPSWRASLWMNILDNGLWMVCIGLAIVIILRKVMMAIDVGWQEVFGALTVYLLLGLLFTQMYEIALFINPASIWFDQGLFKLGASRTGEVLYFSIMTLATVGYGDVLPSAPMTRSICVIETLVGVMYIGVLVARFVSLHAVRNR